MRRVRWHLPVALTLMAVTACGGSHTTLSELKKDPALRQMPPDATVASRQEVDRHENPLTGGSLPPSVALVLHVTSPDAVVTFYRSALTRLGWRESATEPGLDQVAAAEFTRGNRVVNVVVTREADGYGARVSETFKTS